MDLSLFGTNNNYILRDIFTAVFLMYSLNFPRARGINFVIRFPWREMKTSAQNANTYVQQYFIKGGQLRAIIKPRAALLFLLQHGQKASLYPWLFITALLFSDRTTSSQRLLNLDNY